jgi:hypothetical protein
MSDVRIPFPNRPRTHVFQRASHHQVPSLRDFRVSGSTDPSIRAFCTHATEVFRLRTVGATTTQCSQTTRWRTVVWAIFTSTIAARRVTQTTTTPVRRRERNVVHLRHPETCTATNAPPSVAHLDKTTTTAGLSINYQSVDHQLRAFSRVIHHCLQHLHTRHAMALSDHL